jgi:polar amino acid transport system ATP-binding protein
MAHADVSVAEDPSAAGREAAAGQAAQRPMVRAVDVHKRYGRDEVLKGISLEVAAGEVLCLIGPSGSGKSTFLRCINHL